MSSQPGIQSGEKKQKLRNVPATQSPRVLLADDDASFRALLSLALQRAGYEVTECCDGWDLLSRVSSFILPRPREDYHLIISDIRMPRMTGLKILEELSAVDGYPPTILITAFGDDGTHEAAHRAGVAAVLDKPFPIERLLQTVAAVLSRRNVAL